MGMGIVRCIEEAQMTLKYHACATCVNFAAGKTKNGMVYRCVRLGFETKPNYQFNCWVPKENVKKLIEKHKDVK
jgi:hypothetical protein